MPSNSSFLVQPFQAYVSPPDQEWEKKGTGQSPHSGFTGHLGELRDDRFSSNLQCSGDCSAEDGSRGYTHGSTSIFFPSQKTSITTAPLFLNPCKMSVCRTNLTLLFNSQFHLQQQKHEENQSWSFSTHQQKSQWGGDLQSLFLSITCPGTKRTAVKVSEPFLHGMVPSTNKTNWKRERIIDFNNSFSNKLMIGGSFNRTNSLQLKAVVISTPSLLTGVIKPEPGQEMQRREVPKEKGLGKKPRCYLTDSHISKHTKKPPVKQWKSSIPS